MPSGSRSTIRRQLGDGDALPAWFSCGLYSVLVWCATAGGSALILLWANAYHASVAVGVATIATAIAWRFRPRARAGDRAAHAPALAAVAIALVLLALAGAFHSEHLLADRDPAVYINTGRSIARTHEVSPKIAPSPFDDQRTFTPITEGFEVVNQRLRPNFLAFLPALLALGWSAGGDAGLLLVPALLGALGLLALYALATTVVGPRWALLGPALLTLAPLQAWFARDAFAELPVELLALGGIWLFIETRRSGRATAGAIAGVILGSITFARIDALAILVAIPAALGVEHLRAATLEPEERRRRRAVIWSFAIALAATAAIGLIVSRGLSPIYFRDLGHNLRQLELAFGAGIFGAIGIFGIHHLRAGIGQRLARRDVLVALVAASIAVVSVYAYVWRPRSGSPPKLAGVGAARVASRKAFDAYYFSASFRWFAWYLGIFTLTFAVVGVIVLGVRAARADSPALVVLAAAVPMSLLYIARPSIGPDQLWAMRRFLPMVLPALTIAAAAGATWATAAIAARRPSLHAPLVALAVAAMLIPATIAGLPFAGARTQGGALDAVHELCHAAGSDAAIAVEPYGLLGTELPQTLRGFCGVPAAGIASKASTPAVPLPTYAREWKDAGRRLYVVSAARAPVLASASNAVPVAHVVIADAQEPERTYGRRPHKYAPRPVEAWLYRLDPV